MSTTDWPTLTTTGPVYAKPSEPVVQVTATSSRNSTGCPDSCPTLDIVDELTSREGIKVAKTVAESNVSEVDRRIIQG